MIINAQFRHVLAWVVAVAASIVLGNVFAWSQTPQAAKEPPGKVPPKAAEIGKSAPADPLPVVAFDGFQGKLSLPWKPVRHDPTHVSLKRHPGKLTIITQRGSIHGDEKIDQVPNHDWVEAKPDIKKVWLRIYKKGTTYRYAYSYDGKKYEVWGEQIW